MSISMKVNVDRPIDFWYIVDRLPNTQNMSMASKSLIDAFYEFANEYLAPELEDGISGIDFDSIKTIDDCRDELKLMLMIQDSVLSSYVCGQYDLDYEDFDDEEAYIDKSIDFIIKDMKDGSLPLDVYMEDASTLRYCVSSPYQYYLWIPKMDRILPFSILE